MGSTGTSQQERQGNFPTDFIAIAATRTRCEHKRKNDPAPP